MTVLSGTSGLEDEAAGKGRTAELAQVDGFLLARFRSELERVYGDRLERVVLFGSRARGDHTPESDYDIAVFLRDPGSVWTELGHLAAITTEFLLEDAFLSAKPFGKEQWWDDTPFMRNVRRDGIEF